MKNNTLKPGALWDHIRERSLDRPLRLYNQKQEYNQQQRYNQGKIYLQKQADQTTGTSGITNASGTQSNDENTVMNGFSGLSATGQCSLMDPEGAAFSVYQAILKLMAWGGWPERVSCSLVLAEGTDEEELKAITAQIIRTCSLFGIPAEAPAAMAAPGLKASVLTVYAFGRPHTLETVGTVGKVQSKKQDEMAETGPKAGAFETSCAETSCAEISCAKPATLKPGMDLVMSGFAGWRGSVMLAHQYKEAFEKRFSGAFLRGLYEATPMDAHKAIEAAVVVDKNALRTPAMIPLGEGGIFGAAWAMAERAGLGCTLDLKKILLRQETVEVCDYLDVTPYRLHSEGCMLFAAHNGIRLVEAFAGAGIPSEVIGHLTGDKNRTVVNEEETRFLEPFRGDSLGEAKPDNHLV